MAFPTDSLIARYHIESISVGDGNAAPQWDDSSGNGHHLTQGTGANQPLYRAVGLNGLPALEFDGINDAYTVSFGQTLAQPSTIIIVGQILTDPGGNVPFVDGIASGNRHFVGHSSDQLQIWAGSFSGGGMASFMSPVMFGGTFGTKAADVGTLIWNGVSDNVQRAMGSHTLTGITVGANQAQSLFLHCYLTDVLVYNKALTRAELTQIEDELLILRGFRDFGFGVVDYASRYIYGVLADNGFVYCTPHIPSTTDKILKINPATLETLLFDGGVSLAPSWAGFIKAPNGKLYGVPNTESDILEVDPSTDAVVRRTGDGTSFYGGAESGGRIYFCPRASSLDYVLVFDTADNSTYRITLTGIPTPPGADLWGWFIKGNNGKLYGAPRGAGSVLVIDPSDDSFSYITTNVPQLDRQYTNGVLDPGSGEIYLLPRAATTVMVVDPATDTVRHIGTFSSATDKWNGGVLGDDGKIYFFPRSSQNNRLRIDPSDDSMDQVPTISSHGVGDSFVGAVKTDNGIILVPYERERPAYWWETGISGELPGGSVTVIRTVDVDALLQKQISITNTVDAQLSKTLLTTLDIDAVLSRSIAVLTEIDALLTVTQTAQTNVDSVLQMRREVTTDINALLSKMQALVTDVDAVLIAAGITAITTEVDALLQKIRSVVVTSDALLRKNLSSQVMVDSILQTRSTITTLINAVLQKTQLITLTVDSVLFDINAPGFQGSAGGFNLSQPSVNLGAARSVSFGASRSFVLDNPRGFRRSS